MFAKLNFNPIKEITLFGSTTFYIFLLILSFFDFDIFIFLLLGFIITFGIALIIRLLYFKKRPLKQTYANFIEKVDASSFPSLHVARSIFLTLVIHKFFNNYFLSIFFLIIAILVAFSRIYLKKHDIYDVLGGLVLGIIGYYLVNFVISII
ncbi:MAG TPA: phosphatase PAP2 family protein [Candidatus Nanoarchaeia archaeon]|nr:phosphatase PAP2 family protein [Candidatus Nanoarchaeia archaeon]